MTESELRRYLDESVELLMRLSQQVESGLVERVRLSLVGHVGSSRPRLEVEEEDLRGEEGHADPVGDLALVRDRAREDLGNLARLAKHVYGCARLLDDIATRHAAIPAPATPDTAPAGCCRSCWRDDGYREPIAVRPDGSPYWKGRCRWCGAFEAEHRIAVPLQVLRARHRGERVTTAMVAKYLPKKAG